MKTSIIAVAHHSLAFRPGGDIYFKAFIGSLLDIGYSGELIVFDNGSSDSNAEEIARPIKNLHYTYVADQFQHGLTGAWNIGIKQSIALGADLIFVTNDDVELDNSFYALEKAIISDQDSGSSVYGPITSAVDLITFPDQKTAYTGHNRLRLAKKSLYGFFFGFTASFYHNFKQPNGDLFLVSHPYCGGNIKWCGQEEMFLSWKKAGAKLKIFEGCMVKHEGKKSWRVPELLDRLRNHVTPTQFIHNFPDAVSALRNNLTLLGKS